MPQECGTNFTVPSPMQATFTYLDTRVFPMLDALE